MGGELYGGEDPGALGPPPDLQQAIHAAAKALWQHGPFPNLDPKPIARIAVEAAWPHMAGQLQAAQAQVERLRDLLAKYAEWAGVTTIDDGTGTQPTYYCPACRNSRKRGHKPNCPIHAALGQVDQP